MATNISPYNLEIDLRAELQELFTGDEFVKKYQPYVLRQSIKDKDDKKIRCTCYNSQTNEGESDCPYCYGVGFLWNERIIPAFRWIPRIVGLSEQSSYKSYGGKVARLLGSDYVMIIPYYVDVSKNDIIIVPKTDTNGGIVFPIMQKERLFIADVFDRAFDLGKQDYTIIGVGAA